MISKKVCMVGAFAVGKTSLVKQFVESIFDEKYHTTIGVKIDKKNIEIGENEIQLMIWDIEGVDIFTDLKPSYLRGASGVLLVVDGTRPKTLATAVEIKKLVDSHLKDTHCCLLLNKCDLVEQWKIDKNQIKELAIPSQNTFETSAKNGENVEVAFRTLAEKLLQSQLADH